MKPEPEFAPSLSDELWYGVVAIIVMLVVLATLVV